MASRFLSCFFLMNNLLCSHVCTNQPRESQISRPAIARGFTDMPHELVNPRVGSSSTCDPEVAVPGTAAKDPGECQGSRPIYSDARKRAFRRARRRAERCREPCIEDAGTQLVSLELAGMTDRQVIPEPGPLAGGPFVVICRGRHSRACV